MSVDCDTAAQGVGTGVAAALAAVDCVSGQLTEESFGRLFAADGALAGVLTLLLTMYVAFFGISLLIGRSNVGVRTLIPKMMTLGLVLTFATSWVAYQSVVWNIFVGGPDYLAGVITGSEESATQTFASKLDVVFIAVQQASAGQTDIDLFSPPGMMWAGALLLLLGTVGVLVTARIALALLVALGPIFVVMALFKGTRGLFSGWLKGLVMLAVTPIIAVLGGSVMLELAVPVLAGLVTLPGEIDPQAAMAFFLVGAVHLALMAMSLKVAATMVSSWQVFGFANSDNASDGAIAAPRAAAPAAPLAPDRAARAAPVIAPSPAQGGSRSNVASSLAQPANDTGSSGGGSGRETRIYAVSGATGPQAGGASTNARTRGIGNRFRSARQGGDKAGSGASSAPAPKKETIS